MLIMHWADRLGFLSKNHFLFGIDCLPPIYPTAILLSVSFLSFLLKFNSIINFVSILSIVSLCITGDVSHKRLRVPTEKALDTVTVLAQNVQYYAQGIEKVFDSLLAIRPDVAFLSENDLNDSETVYVKKKIAPYDFRQCRRFGPALFSRFPIISCSEIELPTRLTSLSGPNDVENRGIYPKSTFLHAVINVNGKEINFISIRFIAGRPKNKSLSEQLSWGHYLLQEQIKECEFVTHYIENLQGPVIFGGDLNATPSSKIIRPLRDHFQDTYLACHILGKPTFRVGLPLTRIDYIFCSNQCYPLESKVLNTIIADHYPVWSKIGVLK